MINGNERNAVAFVTLGCAKNEADTRHMSEALAQNGYQIVDSLDDCDCIVVNTCAFIEAAAQESIDEILDLAGDETLASRNVGIVVAGCLPSRFGDSLEDALTEAQIFVPCDKESDIAEAVSACLSMRASVDDRVSEVMDAPLFLGPDALEREPAGEEPNERRFSYVKISDGCSRFCSYCTIPFIRGPYKSYTLEQIDEECAALIAQGVREIVLIGQDTGLWGTDLDGCLHLSDLLEHLANAHPDTWFRIMYTQPENVSDDLLDVINRYENICPYLDIPMQHCSASILKAMNRTGSREDLNLLIENARERVPGIALRTTLMCGFPGETEEDFDELVDFVEESRFDYVGVFAFSPEEGTKASMMKDQVPDDEREYRAERLRTIADAISTSVIAEREGRTYPFLCEGTESDGQGFGRCSIQAPEVDGITFCNDIEPGCITEVLVSDTFMYDMEADPIG